MKCEQCNSEMIFKINKGTQGWYCPQCNWNLVTSYIEDLNIDETEYSLYIKIKKTSVIDFEKIKIVSKIANVNCILFFVFLATLLDFDIFSVRFY